MIEQINLVPKRRFKKFSNTLAWEQRKLGDDVADIIGGGTPSTSNHEYWNGDIDWYSPTEIGEKVYANGSEKKITELGLQKSSAKVLPEAKTILFTSRAGIGNMAILQRSGATNQGFQSLVLKEGYDTYFIYSMGHLIKQYAEKYSSGSTFLEISGKMLSKMEIKVPTIEEQLPIGQFFQNLDNLITLHQRKLDKTKALKSAYLSEMFPPEGERVPKRRFAGFTDAWEQRKLGEVVQIKDSARIPNKLWTTSGVRYLRSSDLENMNPDDRLFITRETYEKYKAYTDAPECGDIIFNGGGNIGFAIEKVDNSPVYVQGGAILYAQTSKSNILNATYLKTFFSCTQMRKYIEISSVGGTIKHFTLKPANNAPILLPHIDEQKQIGSFFCNLDNLITLHQLKLEKLQNIKKAYLHEMFV